MRRNLGCDQSRDRAAGVGVEVESGALTLLEPKESGAGDHCRVICGQPRGRSKNRYALGLEPGSHRGRESAITGDAAAQDDTRREYAPAARAAFSTKVSITESWNPRAISALSASMSLEPRTALRTAVLRPLNE